MKNRKRSHRYFSDEGKVDSVVAVDEDLPGTSEDDTFSKTRRLANDEKTGERQVCSDGDLFNKQFEASFGYVKNGNTRRKHFTKKQSKHFRWDEEEKIEKSDTNHVVKNKNWTEGRHGVPEDGPSNDEDFNIPELSQSFPNDLVSYLKSLAKNLKDADKETVEVMKRKCLEECSNSEVLLLRFESSCRVVEEVFEGYEPAAISFHTAVLKLPGTLPLDALLTSCTCRTLETLMFALSTTGNEQIFAKWTEIIVKNWSKLIEDRSSSYYVRSLVRALVKLPKRGSNGELNVDVDGDKKLRQSMVKEFNANGEIKRCFRSIVEVALDFEQMKCKINTETVSLVLQEVVEGEWLVKGGKRKDFVLHSVNEPNEVLKQCRGKFGSHFWQVLVKRLDEETKELLYNTVISTNLSALAQDQYATYVVDTFISTATSEELVTSIFEEICDAVVDLCDKGKWMVVIGLIKASRDHVNRQKDLVKKIRNCFFCAKKSERVLLVPKVFTMQTGKVEIKGDGRVEFDVRFGDYNGSRLLQEMLKLKHNKTVVASLKNLSEETLLNLALNEKGTFLIQAFLNSDAVLPEDKSYIGNILKHNWERLIGDRFGSYVFDALWNSGVFTIGTKRTIMLKLCAEFGEGKSGQWRMMVKKLNVQGFKENRRGWLKLEQSRTPKLAAT